MLPKILPTLFIHLKHPQTGERLFFERTVDTAEGQKTESAPVGVTVYTPGSKTYRTAANLNATENIKAGKKELNGAKLDEQQVNLLARTTISAQGIPELATLNFESLKAFYDNEENVAYREQIADEQADLGKSCKTSAKG